jgi:DNA-binding winged helix-turn-helix (wHTH) protein
LPELGAAAQAQSRYVCFGGFQLDTQRELLYKDGAKMRLPGKVFHTLVALVERPGEVVTREALREKLWPEGTFVNYDANVNTTVNKLRLVLGDSPDQPSFIETIPRLGYCFVGSVHRRNELQRPMATEAAPPVASATLKGNTAALPAAALVQPAQVVEAKPLSSGKSEELWSDWRMKGLAAVVLLCGMLIGMGIVFLTHRG